MPELLLQVLQHSFALAYRGGRLGSSENLEVQFFESELLTDRIEHSRCEDVDSPAEHLFTNE
jgi:hypothetical protein